MASAVKPNAPAPTMNESPGTFATAVSAAETTVAIVKEVGEMLQNIPYVKSVAGIVLQIIKIKDVRLTIIFASTQ